MKYVLPILILSNFLIIPNLSFRWGKEVSVQLIILITICSLIWKRNKHISLFVLWSVLIFIIHKSLLVNDIGQGSTYQVNIPAFFNIINIVLYGLFYYVLHELRLDKRKIIQVFCVIGAIQAGYILLQYFDYGQFFFKISGSAHGNIRVSWPTAFWGNEALASWSIALCSPFFLGFKKLRYKLGYALCGAGILATGCTAGLLAYAGGFLFWLFFTKRKIAVVLIATGLVVVGTMVWSGRLNPEDNFNPRHRLKIWAKTIEITNKARVPIGENQTAMRRGFITGQGLGGFRQLFWANAPEFRGHGHWAQAHNDYLQTLFEHGIVGLIIMLSLMITTFYKFIKTNRE